MIFQGILLGLSLSFMIGPLLFAIMQASLDRGFRAGIALAAGIWASDVLYLYLIYRWVDALAALAALPNFSFWAGLCGSSVLLVFGVSTLLARKVPVSDEHNTAADRVLDVIDGPEPTGAEHNWTRWGYPGYTLRGFLLNTINPFTVFFWLGLASAFVVSNKLSPRESVSFFGGMLLSLVATDVLKAYAAKRLRSFLNPRHVLLLQKGIGVALLISGVVLFVRVLV
ncbi:MAG: LysE family transporter [Saprospiraceae bacterium]